MVLEEGLQEFLKESIEEEKHCNVEGGFYRMLTQEETDYINAKLKKYGYSVYCHRCETCEEYSNGKDLFHIGRDTLR
jgi:hypothetical protein